MLSSITKRLPSVPSVRVSASSLPLLAPSPRARFSCSSDSVQHQAASTLGRVTPRKRTGMEPNYYAGGGHVNRLSWMRQSTEFLHNALTSPKARFILYHELNPLILTPEGASSDHSQDGSAILAHLPFSAIAPHLGLSSAPDDLAAVAAEIIGPDGSMWPGQLAKRTPETADDPLDRYPIIVFLGSDESGIDKSLPTKPAKGPDQRLEDHSPGHPVWALDVSSLSQLNDLGSVAGVFHASSAAEMPQGSLDYADMRAGMMALASSEAAVAGQGRALIDWNRRNRYCPGCGRPQTSVWAGWKRTCAEDAEPHPDEAQRKQARPPCISKKGVHNFSYPRTDPVCIMAILHHSEDSILLGRQKVWPKGFYSCLAGFIEPGESLEDSVRREVLEEAGIKVEAVRYHSTQPWPYPGSLMMGAIGVAAPDQKIRTDLDNELEDARFFSRAAVLKALGSKAQSGLTRQELEKIDGKPADQTDDATTNGAEEELKIRLPPRTAIAHRLIESWALKLARYEGSGTEGSAGGATSLTDKLFGKM